VQVALEPDILIIDEALSVGDFFFKQKCATRMRELREAGTTILFVSHSMASVREICDRAIVLRQGDLIFSGDSNQAIRYYLSHGKNTERKVLPIGQVSSGKLELQWNDIVCSEEAMLWQHESIENVLETGGLLGMAIICDEDQEPLIALIGEKRTFRIYFKPIEHMQVIIQFLIKDKYGKLVYGTNSAGQGYTPFTSKESEIICFDLSLTLLLSQGGYSFQCMLSSSEEIDGVEQCETVMKSTMLGPLHIKRDKDVPPPFKGKMGLPIVASLEILN
ncbi:MAG: ABC transporter ATP-binding protein, partial [Proteobacteria bacterium]|nr:ABC transporter ATP-binding protein [Pseudomonadota bacterium]